VATDTLVDDIYRMIDTKEIPDGVPIEQVINDFGENMKQILRDNITEHEFDRRKLRMSNIGKKDRQLWYSYNGYEGEKLLPHTRIKFLYGHLIEEMVLALTKLSGHDVTHEQKQVEVDGIKGSMDCKIDGVLTDVKSASSYGFKKFKDGTLAQDDTFGYLAQLAGYEAGHGTSEGGFLAMNKENGELALYIPEELDKPNIESKISTVKKSLKKSAPPEICYTPIPDGKSGNMKLPIGCSYCHFKHACYPELRTFLYSTGPRYLTEVANEPKVQEVT